MWYLGALRWQVLSAEVADFERWITLFPGVLLLALVLGQRKGLMVVPIIDAMELTELDLLGSLVC